MDSTPLRTSHSPSRGCPRALRTVALAVALMSLATAGRPGRARAQAPEANYDETRVGAYTLPDPLIAADGTRITGAAAWRRTRRAEILTLFQTHVYGRSPGPPPAMRFVVTSVDERALGGKATRTQVSVVLSARTDGPTLDLLIYVPNAATRPVPAFVGLNFFGNQSITTDPGVAISTKWMRPSAGHGIVANRATEKSRGTMARRWPVERILERGYALVTAYYGDLDPDFDDGFGNGVHPLFYRQGQERPEADEWGSIGAWAWGLSRAVDYLRQDAAIDASRLAVVGHSRLGKAALWAGAQDERFAIVIANDSGEGGAALARRNFGETVERLNADFPHWFCANFRKYSGKAGLLPVDQHMLISLAAPRPVYVASASEDLWADPRGEFLAARHAEPVYRLFGLEGLGVADMPEVDRPVGRTIGYHVRTGGHDLTRYDWEQFMAFADRHFTSPARRRTR